MKELFSKKMLVQAKCVVGSVVLAGLLIGCGSDSKASTNSKTSTNGLEKLSSNCDGEKVKNAILDSFVDETFRRMGEGNDEDIRKELKSTLSKMMKFSLINAKAIKKESEKIICKAQINLTTRANPQMPEIKKTMNDVVYKVSNKNNKIIVEFDNNFWQEVDRL